MDILINIFIGIVTLLHLYFLWFEMFDWERTGRRVFKQFDKDLFPKTKSMAANQGLYNGFLAAGLIWSRIIADNLWSNNVALFFLACVAVAGIYGALTVSKKIFMIQGLPAIIAIILILGAG